MEGHKKRVLLISVVLAFLLWPALLGADTLYLKSGLTVSGKITLEDDVVVRLQEKVGSGYAESDYLKLNIKRIERGTEVSDTTIGLKKENLDARIDDGEDWIGKTKSGIQYKSKRQMQNEFEIAKDFAEGLDAKQIETVIILTTTPIMAMIFAKEEACNEMVSNPLFRKQTLQKWHSAFLTSKGKIGEDLQRDEKVVVGCQGTEVAVIEGGLLGTRILWKL